MLKVKELNQSEVIMKTLFIIFAVFVIFTIAAFVGITIAHNCVFPRVDSKSSDQYSYLTYDEIDSSRYKRELINIPSGDNTLAGYLYGKDDQKNGLIVISAGHQCSAEMYLPEIMYFVDQGFMVLSYDYTGSFGSTGKSIKGYVQAPMDLNTVLTYVENDTDFNELPILLYGHSLGAYTSASVLQIKHNVTAVVAASGFDDPTEQWDYSVKRFTGLFGNMISPYTKLFMKIKFTDLAHFSAIDGINATDIPVMIYQGTTDEFYGNVSSIYEHRDRITNPKCTLKLMEKDKHHGHYDYFLTDAAITYREKVNQNSFKGEIDKYLYNEHDHEIMQEITDFYINATHRLR